MQIHKLLIIFIMLVTIVFYIVDLIDENRTLQYENESLRAIEKNQQIGSKTIFKQRVKDYESNQRIAEKIVHDSECFSVDIPRNALNELHNRADSLR